MIVETPEFGQGPDDDVIFFSTHRERLYRVRAPVSGDLSRPIKSDQIMVLAHVIAKNEQGGLIYTTPFVVAPDDDIHSDAGCASIWLRLSAEIPADHWETIACIKAGFRPS